jgi:hypothetical protein
MSNETSAAGWVIEVKRAASVSNQDAPQNEYFNVAFANAEKATEAAVAAAKKAGFDGTRRHVRSLSNNEIETLHFKPGEVHPREKQPSMRLARAGLSEASRVPLEPPRLHCRTAGRDRNR